MKNKNVKFSASISVTITALIAGFLLSFVYSTFENDIIENINEAIMNNVVVTIPSTTVVEGPFKEDDMLFPYYVGKNDLGETIGYSILSEAKGYNGVVRVLVGFDVGFENILSVAPTEHTETPNLGSKITEDAFRKQFDNYDVSLDFIIVKTEVARDYPTGEISAISGATISSKAVVDAVNAAKEEIVKLKS